MAKFYQNDSAGSFKKDQKLSKLLAGSLSNPKTLSLNNNAYETIDRNSGNKVTNLALHPDGLKYHTVKRNYKQFQTQHDLSDQFTTTENRNSITQAQQ